MLGGTIASLGNSYVLTLGAQDCVNGNDPRRRAGRRPTGKERRDHRARQRGRRRFREKLGESLASVQRYDQNIEQATTKSLEALKAYSQGMTDAPNAGRLRCRCRSSAAPSSSIRSSRWRTRGSAPCCRTSAKRAEAEKVATRAYELRDKVSERERLYIEARYYTTVERETPTRRSRRTGCCWRPTPTTTRRTPTSASLYRNSGRLKEAIATPRGSRPPGAGRSRSAISISAAPYLDEGRDGRRATRVRRGVEAAGVDGRTHRARHRRHADRRSGARRRRRSLRSKDDRAEIDMIATRAQAAALQGPD